MRLLPTAHLALTLSFLGTTALRLNQDKASRAQGTETSAKQAASEATPAPLATSLGAFSLSLAVKDLAVTRAFYEKLGFTAVPGKAQKGWIILRNGPTTLGLFQGFFPKNSLTFNPGWTWDNQPLASFTDVRELQRQLEAQGLIPEVRADENSTGPVYFTLTDPDGNPVLFDQHVDKPVAK
jgi:lactoylglutathione lyase